MDASTPQPAPPAGMPSRFRLGEAVVDVHSREVSRPGARRPHRLTPKAIGVLMVLAAHQGEVVGRNALLAAVWPDTLPTDDVLTQAVTQLRKALGEQADGTRCIETIAKSGYRLVAEVVHEPGTAVSAAVEAGEGTPAAVSPAGQAGGFRRRRVIAGAGAGVLFVLAMLAYRVAVAPDPGDGAEIGLPGPMTLITSLPGYELSPSLSPDASRLAYASTLPDRRGTAVMVQATGHEPPVQLSFPPEGVSDQSPAWSPDGRDIAYLRGPVGGCEIRVAAVDGGAERIVGLCNPGDLPSFSWMPDGSGLLFGSMTRDGEPVGIRRFDLASGDWQPLEYGFARGDLDYRPRYSPDGRWIGFVRNPQLGHLWRVPASGGQAEQLTRRAGEILGWDWLPGGNAMVFSRREGSGTRLYRFDIDSGKETWLGLADVQSPDVSTSGAMAFERRQSRFGLFRFALSDAAAAVAGGEPLFRSSGLDTQPAVSRDGNQLVFTSDRAGRFQLWWARLDDPASLRPIPGVTPSYGDLPQWSPDGSRVLVLGRADASDADAGLYEVAPDSGEVKRLPVPTESAMAAAYLPDPGRLLVVVQDTGPMLRLVLFDRRTRPWKELASIADVSLAKVDPAGGRVLFTRLSANGLWEADPGLAPSSVRQIDAVAPARWRYRAWAITPDGRVLHTLPRSTCLSALHRIADTGTRKSASPQCLERGQLSHPTGFSATDRHAIVSLGTADDTDIAFIAVPASR